MWDFILTNVCYVNRHYQRNKKDIYDAILSEPISILKDVCSEEIIYYKEKIEVRSNWTIEDLTITF